MQSFNLNRDHIMKDVYSYPFPEMRELVADQNLDPSFMFNTLTIEKAAGLLVPYGFAPELSLPAHTDGTLDLDSLHIPVIDRIRSVQQTHLPGIETFANAYPMPGSSQSMFNLIAEWKAKGELTSIAVIEGEYDGYGAYATSLGVPVRIYKELEDIPVEKGQVVFISNPNARAGNWIEADAWKQFVAAGHEIVYDAAYVGLTEGGQVDVSAPNIKAVLTSPSKLFGVFRYRNTGVTYTREPVDCMYGSKWFKDVPALLASLSLYETFGNNELPRRYKKAQQFIAGQLTNVVQAEVVPSDVLLLAHTNEPVASEFEQYRRANVIRFGLAKLFEDLEAH